MTEYRNDKPIPFSIDIAVLADGEPVGFGVVPESIVYTLADEAKGAITLTDSKMSGQFTPTAGALGVVDIGISLDVTIDGGGTLHIDGTGSLELVEAPAPVVTGQITFTFGAAPANPT